MSINNIPFTQRENPAAGPAPAGPAPGPGPAAGPAGPAPGPAAARPSAPPDEEDEVDEDLDEERPQDEEERPSGPATKKELRQIERQARVENRLHRRESRSDTRAALHGMPRDTIDTIAEIQETAREQARANRHQARLQAENAVAQMEQQRQLAQTNADVMAQMQAATLSFVASQAQLMEAQQRTVALVLAGVQYASDNILRPAPPPGKTTAEVVGETLVGVVQSVQHVVVEAIGAQARARLPAAPQASAGQAAGQAAAGQAAAGQGAGGAQAGAEEKGGAVGEQAAAAGSTDGAQGEEPRIPLPFDLPFDLAVIYNHLPPHLRMPVSDMQEALERYAAAKARGEL